MNAAQGSDTCEVTDAPAKYGGHRVARWMALYVALALTPLVVAVLGPLPEPRPFLVEFGVGLGFLGSPR